MYIDRIFDRLQNKRIKYLKKREKVRYESARKKCLSYVDARDFTIISNNCWAGHLYRYFELPYLTPTVGLYFYSDDYLKFISDLRKYVSYDIKIIAASESRHAEMLHERGQDNVPVGVLGDVEVIFLHYKTFDEAYEKWTRRCERINYDNVILKMSQQNMCTWDMVREFDSLPFDNKLIFVNRKDHGLQSGMYFPGFEDKDEVSDVLPFPQHIDLAEILNRKKCRYPECGIKV